jgi:hypothetical protein
MDSHATPCVTARHCQQWQIPAVSGGALAVISVSPQGQLTVTREFSRLSPRWEDALLLAVAVVVAEKSLAALLVAVSHDSESSGGSIGIPAADAYVSAFAEGNNNGSFYGSMSSKEILSSDCTSLTQCH